MNYTVSKDVKSGLYYAHHKKTPKIPVFGSLSSNKWEAQQYAKMYNGLPHKVNDIEKRRRDEFERK